MALYLWEEKTSRGVSLTETPARPLTLANILDAVCANKTSYSQQEILCACTHIYVYIKCVVADERYAHIVLKSKFNDDLFSLKPLLALCRIEHEFIEARYYKDLCVTAADRDYRSKCCKPWSLANYIAILHNRTSCLAITEEDVNATKTLLINCSQYFHKLQLMPDCVDKGYCDAPSECIRHDAVFNVLNFLTSTTFLPPNNTLESTTLQETMIFLPLACSTAMLPYYHEIIKMDLEYEGISVVAMEFGIKDALFDECLLRDAWLMTSGALFVLLCMWLYTESLFLTIMTIIAIIFSLGISYFIYMLVFELSFFPFMNLLAIIVAIGIGADDAFIFCKIWHTVKEEKNSSIVKLMGDTFHHAFFSMFVTSLTTSVAFLASYASSVIAICCFSIFSGTAVITNFLLMITWFPACVVIWERSCCSNVDLAKSCLMACLQRWCCSRFIKPTWNLSTTWPKCSLFGRIWSSKERFLLDSVVNFRYIWLAVLSTIALISTIIVIYYPKFQLPDSSEFQLFDSSHPFEQYDFKYKNHFWFKREERLSLEVGVNFKLPLRFVWGVLPEDNGDHLNPESLGKLVLDPEFDISQPESQVWLLKFCRDLHRQPFFQPTFGPILPNCFIETFIKSMQRECVDSFSFRDRSPCCKTSKFPYNSSVFYECIVEEMTDIYETPSQYLIPGMAGPKFSKDQFPTIKAVIVEYDSNYSYSMSYEYMHEFYTKVEKWMSEELKTAPKTMKNGWFISELEFYDLQRELSENTILAIIVSMGLALIVLLLSTLNILTSLYAILTITCSIFVTVAVLVLLGWKLNILESITVSTAIGLTVDFSLHYTVNYRLCPLAIADERIAATKYALSYMAGPVLMAALTTGAAGAFMMPSLILPYIQVGVFLVTVMSVSWIYATFHLGAMLAIIGPQNQFGQFHYSKLSCCPSSKSKTSSSERNRPVNSSLSDTHELDSLTCKSGVRPVPRALQRSLSSGGVGKNNPNRYVFTDQSPSATSAITIIMADDN
ncbi:unnamed protein product [Tenebrio molitor]|jgi:hypothetical protein|nr:unnamed protein product [Tenebrio molitor]